MSKSATLAQSVAPRAITKQAGRAPKKSKLAQFDVMGWRTDVEAAALQYVTAASSVLRLVLAARGMVEADTAREAVQHAFAAALASTNGVSFEEACKAPSVRNRVSEAMAVFNCETLPASLPNNLQHAAAAVRKAKAGTKPRQPKAKGEGDGLFAKQEGTKASPMALMQLAIDGFTAECGDNVEALNLLVELRDLAFDLVQAMKGEGGIVEGEFEEVANA